MEVVGIPAAENFLQITFSFLSDFYHLIDWF